MISSHLYVDDKAGALFKNVFSSPAYSVQQGEVTEEGDKAEM